MLLIEGIFGDRRPVQSLGITAIAAWMRQLGQRVDLWSPAISGWSEEETAARAAAAAPPIIGISCLTRFQRPGLLQIASSLRSRGWSGPLVVGGHWPTIDHHRILLDIPAVDCVAVGDGEQTAADLAARVAAEQDWRDVHGIAYRAGGSIARTPTRTHPSLDHYPRPADDIVSRLAARHGPTIRVSLLSSRGCYANCSYCSVGSYASRSGAPRYRLRDPARVVEDMADLARKFGVRSFCLEDDNFVPPGPAGTRRVSEFCGELRTRGLDFDLTLQTRPECVTHQAFAQLRDVGLRDVFIGIESLDQGTLDLYGRDTTVAEACRSLEVLENLGFSARVDSPLRLRVGSMVFQPYITLPRLLVQCRLFRQHGIPAKKLLKRLRPAEGTPLGDRLAAEGLVGSDGEYRYVVAEVDAMYRLLRQAFDRSYPLRERIRTVEKKAAIHHLDVDLAQLRAARVQIDDLVYDLFERMCVAGERDGIGGLETAVRWFNDQERASAAIARARDIVPGLIRDLEDYQVNN